MPREIDEKKTRKALRRLARAKQAAESSEADASKLSEWEDEFLDSLEERLDRFGSAFNDPDKGDLDNALSARQGLKLREIEKKAKGKDRKPMSRGSGFRRKTPQRRTNTRDINEDVIEGVDPPGDADQPRTDTRPDGPARTGFKPVIIEGGKQKS